jgi:hypothetical protein
MLGFLRYPEHKLGLIKNQRTIYPIANYFSDLLLKAVMCQP